MESDVKYQRKRGDDFSYKGSKDKSQVVDNEVKRLLRENIHSLSHADMLRLRDKLGDEELVDQIQDALADKLKKIKSRAKKFAKAILEKYGTATPLHILLRKALKYKKHYNLSDAEFDEFEREYERNITGEGSQSSSSIAINVPKTNISKVLGTIVTDMGDGIRYSENEAANLQDILKLYAASKGLHSQIVLQTLTYGDLAVEALTGTYDRNKNSATFIHPVLAALYLPKINVLDEHTLLANVAGIINSRYNKQPIMTKPDYELFYDLISDPNDMVCDKNSTIADLHKRCNLQVQLWKCVLNLRQGKYYDASANDFLMAVDSCKLSHFDTPDLLYAGDEGVVLRRVMAAFSLRPTIVSTTPLYGVLTNDPTRTGLSMPRVNSLPMVSLRLPQETGADMGPIKLTDALDQSQLFLENNTIVPKNQAIIYSKGMIVFYVNRRAHSLDITKLTDPYNFTKLPITIAGFERINTRRVIFEESIKIRDDPYSLRSVVIIDTNSDIKDLVVGCSTALRRPADFNKGVTDDEYFIYNPRIASQMYNDGTQNFTRGPIMTLRGYPTISSQGTPSFFELGQRFGTIFIYTADSDTRPEGKLYF